jgi:hypothetical protein
LWDPALEDHRKEEASWQTPTNIGGKEEFETEKKK